MDVLFDVCGLRHPPHWGNSTLLLRNLCIPEEGREGGGGEGKTGETGQQVDQTRESLPSNVGHTSKSMSPSLPIPRPFFPLGMSGKGQGGILPLGFWPFSVFV